MNVWAYLLNSAGWAFAGYYAAILNHRLCHLRRHLPPSPSRDDDDDS